jgi:hypothetical protein
MPVPRDARREAFDRLGGRFEVRVLEPSPPAVAAEPFTDDPARAGEVPEGRTLVTPTTAGTTTWDELAREDPGLAGFAADRWLGAWRRLEAPPPQLAATRRALHRLAEEVIAPTRQRANGKIGLRYTRGGFGTPFFAADAQIRVEGDELVVAREREEWRRRITSLRGAADFIGHELTRLDGKLDDVELEVDPAASRFLGDWYGLAASVLEQLRAEAGRGDAPSLVQLWPEHFDMALDLGDEGSGARANYGFSPGDDAHDEPYVYVGPWTARPRGPLWQATGFPGAELPLTELLAAPDQRGTVLAWLRERRDALRSWG